MEISTNSFSPGGPIPSRYALARPDPDTRVAFAENISPHLAWSDAPEGTRSFALICHDFDCPSSGEDVNQPDREVPPDLPRVDWQLIIETPVAAAGLNTSRIALQRSPVTLEYYANANWTDVAPLMVQTLLIESFENSGKIVAVSRDHPVAGCGQRERAREADSARAAGDEGDRGVQ